MKYKSDKVVKGIIFAGCSFTWGQGLYYYSNLPTLKEPEPFRYDNKLVKATHIKFMESVRFPRLVSNHFNTFELVHPVNGGSHGVATEWWNKSFAGKEELCFQFTTQPLDYSDISCLVFQCTQWPRNFFSMEYQGETYHIPCAMVYNITGGLLTAEEENIPKIFVKWLDEKNLTLVEWENFHKKNNIDMVKTFLQEVESRGIKTVIFTWPDENVEYIKNDPWLRDRFMTIDYQNKTFDSMDKFMWDSPEHKELIIATDTDAFEIPPNDHHPSLICHRVMADNIIKHLEKIL